MLRRWEQIILDWVELGEVVVVHMEEVLEDRVVQVRRILHFLHIVPDERRLECVKYGKFDFYKVSDLLSID